jgi:hypothetical protein
LQQHLGIQQKFPDSPLLVTDVTQQPAIAEAQHMRNAMH